MKGKKRHRLLRCFLLGVMAVCLFLLGRAYYRTMEQKNQQKELLLLKEKAAQQEEMETEVTTEPGSEEESETRRVMMKQYRGLYKKNKDLAGWITIDGTVIDYPVMQCEDNEYYLHHDFYKKDSLYGTLYVKDIADLEKGTNFIIYGHNMNDGSMFGNLDLYQNKEYYLEHPKISFDTLYEERTYQIVAVFRSQVYNVGDDVFKYYRFYQADTKKEFNDFYRNIKALSLYDTGVKAKFGDTFLTLSTCAYHVEDGRFVVVAKRLH